MTVQHNQHKTLHNPGYVTLIILLHPLLGGPCHPKVLAVMEDRLTIPSVSLLFPPPFPELFFILQHVGVSGRGSAPQRGANVSSAATCCWRRLTALMQRLKLLMLMGFWSRVNGHTLPVLLWFSIKTHEKVVERAGNPVNNGPHLRG